MEAFEQFVAVAVGAEGYVVSSNLKFPIARQTKKKKHVEVQEHGYEVDLVGARADRLLLVSVKSMFGSKGVRAVDVDGTGKWAKRYKLLNDVDIRTGVIALAAKRFGYTTEQVRLRLTVGKFAGKGTKNEDQVRAWCDGQVAGGGAIELLTVREVVEQVRKVAGDTTYVDNSVVVALKVLAAANVLDLARPIELSGTMLGDLGLEDEDEEEEVDDEDA